MRRRDLAVTAWMLRLEAPTWVLAFTIYAGWVALTFCWHSLPICIAAPLAAWLTAWHMSLQHELIHGHPTRNERVNAALASPPLNLWLPYALYRDEHLLHHRDEHLTDPLEDPESTYLCEAEWLEASPARRWLLRACTTSPGRVLLGPPLAVARFWTRQARLIGQGRAPWAVWGSHLLAASLILAWVCGVCGISPLTYLLCFVYPGTALIMIRSLAEHRAAVRPADRTAVVERAGLLGLLFLNNNLHVLHHARPGLAWYALPAQWRLTRGALLATRGGPVYRGYFEILRRYALRAHHPGRYPL